MSIRMEDAPRRVAVVATGGTIQNTAAGRVPLDDVLERLRTVYDAALPAEWPELDVREVLREGAETFGPREWSIIADAVTTAAEDPGVSGIVVTHGTFTAEETAFVLHLVTRTSKPIVLAVSQRKHRQAGNDGDRNLIDAVRVALDPAAAGRGVLLVAADEIHSARDVTKENQRPSGFSSGTFGVLGTVETDGISFWRHLERRHTTASSFRAELLRALPRVDIVAVYAGADAFAIDAAVAAGARGIVTSGFPYSGRPTATQEEALRRAAEQGVAVVYASRGRGGRIPAVEDRWFARADSLPPHKARILLALALADGVPSEALQELFDAH